MSHTLEKHKLCVSCLEIKMSSVLKKNKNILKSHSECYFLVSPKEFVAGNRDSHFFQSLATRRKACKVS